MNSVSLVGRVSDRPFRPGGGARVVIKVTVRDSRTGRSDQIEVDAFGPVGAVAINLFQGDHVAVEGRLEDRTYKQDGQEVQETRCVAESIETLVKSRDIATAQSPPR
jgi:single-stranded DNA-binding protein